MPGKDFPCQAARYLMAFCFVASVGNASACTISEDMTSSLPLNSTEIPNSDRIRIADMMLAAKQWPNVEIRGIVYAGGYIKEKSEGYSSRARGNPQKLSGSAWCERRKYLA
jgi:hypothetical protein